MADRDVHTQPDLTWDEAIAAYRAIDARPGLSFKQRAELRRQTWQSLPDPLQRRQQRRSAGAIFVTFLGTGAFVERALPHSALAAGLAAGVTTMTVLFLLRRRRVLL